MTYCYRHKRVPTVGRSIYSCVIFMVRVRFVAPLGLYYCPSKHWFVAPHMSLDWMLGVEE